MSTNAEHFVKIGPVVGEMGYSVGYANFCSLIQKGAVVVNLVTSGVTGLICIKFAPDVDKILPLNIFWSELQYYNPFWNATLPNEPIYRNFALKLVALATSFEELEKEIQIDHQ